MEELKLGEKLTELKTEHCITRKDLSKEVDIDVLTIKAIEHSNTGNLPKIKTLFNFFGFKVYILLEKKGKKKIKIEI
jgi:transcriptional regulator with XRE-family HTH domain